MTYALLTETNSHYIRATVRKSDCLVVVHREPVSGSARQELATFDTMEDGAAFVLERCRFNPKNARCNLEPAARKMLNNERFRGLFDRIVDGHTPAVDARREWYVTRKLIGAGLLNSRLQVTELASELLS